MIKAGRGGFHIWENYGSACHIREKDFGSACLTLKGVRINYLKLENTLENYVYLGL